MWLVCRTKQAHSNFSISHRFGLQPLIFFLVQARVVARRRRYYAQRKGSGAFSVWSGIQTDHRPCCVMASAALVRLAIASAKHTNSESLLQPIQIYICHGRITPLGHLPVGFQDVTNPIRPDSTTDFSRTSPATGGGRASRLEVGDRCFVRSPDDPVGFGHGKVGYLGYVTNKRFAAIARVSLLFASAEFSC